MIERAQIVAEARSWLGTPYQHQQRLKGVAVDCAGLVIGVARALGIVAPGFDVNGYARMPDGTSLLAECARWMTPTADPQPGDVLVLRWHRDPQHMAIVTPYQHGGLAIVHALGTVDGKGRVIEQRLAETMRSRIVCAWRMPGVA